MRRSDRHHLKEERDDVDVVGDGHHLEEERGDVDVVGDGHHLEEERGDVDAPVRPQHEERQGVSDEAEEADGAEHEHVQHEREPVAVGARR